MRSTKVLPTSCSVANAPSGEKRYNLPEASPKATNRIALSGDLLMIAADESYTADAAAVKDNHHE